MRYRSSTCGLLVLASLTACGPNYSAVTNKLRVEKLAQEKEIASLKQQVATDEAIIKSTQEQLNGKSPRVETLPPERLAELFTVGSIDIQSATDSSDLGTGDKSLKGFRVYVRTLTTDRMVFPATGTLTIEAFELPPSPDEPVRVGTWTIPPAEMKKNWYSGLGLNHFAFNLPWTKPPGHPDVTFKVTFADALTGNVFTAHLDKKITLP